METLIHWLVRCFHFVSELLRIPGYIPFVSIITGTARVLINGLLQGLLGKVVFVVSLFLMVVAQIIGHGDVAKYWLASAKLAFTHIVQSILETWRGLLEGVPILGNLAVFFYDKATKGKSVIPYPKV